MNIANTIDHTLLKAVATEEEIVQICKEAIQYQFKTVCVPACYVQVAYDLLQNTEIGITTVVGFPLGNETSSSKAFEAKEAILNGATDIDMVINIGALKGQRYDYVENDIKEVVNACKHTDPHTIVKVIIETCYLTEDEIRKVTEIVAKSGADFIKTSTGFGTGGATVEDVKLMAQVAAGRIKVKASGGISDTETALKMIEAGAHRLGVSKGIAIVTGQSVNNQDNY